MAMFRVLWISTCCWVLISCASSKDSVFTDDMPTMKTIYTKKFGDKSLDNTHLKKRPLSDSDLAGLAKTHYQTLSQQFPVLPNPVIVTYVYPHLTQAGTPIPGYVTYFKLYLSDQMALPGEVFEESTSEVNP